MTQTSELNEAEEPKWPPITGQTPLTSSVPQYECPRRYIYKQHLAALLANLLSVNVGMVLTWTAPAVPILLGQVDDPQPLRLTLEQTSWVGGVMPLASLGGALVAGPLAQRFGRRGALLWIAVPALVGCLLITFAGPLLSLLLAGRILQGAAMGAVHGPVAMYCEEIAQVQIRGALGTYHFLCAVLGTVVSYGLGGLLRYFWFNAVAVLPVLVFLATFYWMPETPAYLATCGRHKEAKAALEWLRGPNADYDLEVETQLASRSRTPASHNHPVRSFTSLCSRRPFRSNALRSVAILMILFFLQQMCGIGLFSCYTVQVFQQLGGSISSHLSSFILGIGTMIAVMLATVTVDCIGRRTMLMISALVMSACLAILIVHTQLNINKVDMEGWNWIPLATLFLYGAMFSIGVGPIPWFLMAELLPMYAKSWACPAAVCVNKLCMFLVVKEGPLMLEVVGQVPTYAFFAVFCFLTAVFVKLYIPETSGRTKADILKEIGGTDP